MLLIAIENTVLDDPGRRMRSDRSRRRCGAVTASCRQGWSIREGGGR
ncbi:hypothetical protein [Lysobacter gummosus]